MREREREREREMNKKYLNIFSTSNCMARTLLLLEHYCSSCQIYLAFDTFDRGLFLVFGV